MALTLKMEVFCNEFVVTGNQSEAYRRAFDTENMKPETINNEAYKLMQRREIAARVDKLKEGIAVKYEITVDDLVKELEEARELAFSTGQPSAMVTAINSKAKLLGLLTDKVQVTKVITIENLLGDL